MHTATMTAEAAPTTIDNERDVLAVDTASAQPPAPAARPRLSQTITLGEGTEAQYSPSAPPPTGISSGQPGVVVNNNVYVQQPAYGGGYVSYGGYRGYGMSRSNDGRGGYGSNAWSTTGWEGARRTAAPGQTPGVGGNWAPVPSHGPATMK